MKFAQNSGFFKKKKEKEYIPQNEQCGASAA